MLLGSSNFWLSVIFTFFFVLFASSKIIFTDSQGIKQVVEELDKILAFNNLLISLKNHPDADRCAPGVGPVSLLGKDHK